MAKETFTRRPLCAPALLCILVLAAACSEVAGPDAARRDIGILQLQGADLQAGGDRNEPIRWSLPPGTDVVVPSEVIQAPDTVRLGDTVSLTVVTIGPDGCWGADGHDRTVQGRVIEIQPYDRHSGADFCTQALGYLTHSAQHAFAEPGIWTIRARGRRLRTEDGSHDTPVTAERTVVVR